MPGPTGQECPVDDVLRLRVEVVDRRYPVSQDGLEYRDEGGDRPGDGGLRGAEVFGEFLLVDFRTFERLI